ncbi:hypothetical protein [Kordiimonas sp.]|uniref:hypothetical protein n=1 Tax=Kordiimonas sp. TaxID=1970157 RepID=UPI003A90BA00
MSFRALLCVVVIVVTGHGAQAWAQQRLDAATLEALTERAEENKVRLGLTAEQEEKVTPILEASREKQLGILEKHGFGKGVKPKLSLREKLSLAREMKAVRADTEAALSRHLSREQMKTYKTIQDERRARMKKFMKSRDS